MTDLELLHLITAPTRYQLLTLLLEYHYCVKALAAKLGISEPAVSQQLQVLKDCGLVTGERLDYQILPCGPHTAGTGGARRCPLAFGLPGAAEPPGKLCL